MLYIAVDGTGIPMTASEPAGRAGKTPDGRARTREAKLAALFTQTGLDTDGRPIRDSDSTDYLATLDPVHAFADLVDAQAHRRGAEHLRQLVVLGDGARWIWNLADQRFPAATQIVDPYHAPDTYTPSRDTSRSSSPDPDAWLEDRLTDLDNGDIEAIMHAARGYP
jgi:hypothetical protein